MAVEVGEGPAGAGVRGVAKGIGRPAEAWDGREATNVQKCSGKWHVTLHLTAKKPCRKPCVESRAPVWRLPSLPDIVYLCTSGWEARSRLGRGLWQEGVERGRFGGSCLSRARLRSFLLGDVLVTGSKACEQHGQVRISQLLSDVLCLGICWTP